MGLKKYEISTIEQSQEYIENLHNKNKGYITIANKNPNYSQWHYKLEELISNTSEILQDNVNTYISMNTFYKPQRRIENIKELNIIGIDIDCYKTKYSKQAVKYFLENDLYGSKIPVPTYLIDSGRGLYYILVIDKAPSQVLPLWYAIQRYICNALKEFGADFNALDPTRVLRIVGGINSKSNSVVEILDYNDVKYTLREIQEGYLPELKPKKDKPKKGRPKKVVSLFNEYNLYHTRLLDISKLCELRNYDLKGHREVILFLYRYYSCSFIQEPTNALEKVLGLNAEFKQPLPIREVERDTKSAERYYKEQRYKYSNERLIEMLEITDEEQQHLKTIIGIDEKYRRNNQRRIESRRNEQGLTTREQQKQDTENKIKELINKGLNMNQISKELGKNRSTISRHYKHLF